MEIAVTAAILIIGIGFGVIQICRHIQHYGDMIITKLNRIDKQITDRTHWGTGNDKPAFLVFSRMEDANGYLECCDREIPPRNDGA